MEVTGEKTLVPGQSASQATSTTPAATKTEGEKILGKFASQDELVKAYQESEKKISEYGSKYKDYDSYTGIGSPQEITQALDWARQVKAALERGELIPKGAARTAPASQPNKAPWDSDEWITLDDGRRAGLQSEYLMSQVKSYIDGIAQQYAKQIEGFRQTDGTEKALLLQTIKMAMQNPGIEPDKLLEDAAQFANKSPQELLQLAMEARAKSPEAQEKEIARRVAEQLAEKQQEWEKSRFAEATVSRKPRFGPKAPDRAAEDRGILESLAKNGIRLL